MRKPKSKPAVRAIRKKDPIDSNGSNCVRLAITGRPIIDDSQRPWLQLNLELNFTEGNFRWKKEGGWFFGDQEYGVSFGINGARLMLELPGGAIAPIDFRAHKQPFLETTSGETLVDVTSHISESTEAGISATAEVDLKGPSAKVAPSLAFSRGRKNTRQRRRKGEMPWHQIRESGSHDSPVWLFRSDSRMQMLEGFLSKHRLALVRFSNLPATINATLKLITGLENIVIAELSRTDKPRSVAKGAAIRSLIKEHLALQLSDYIASVEVTVG